MPINSPIDGASYNLKLEIRNSTSRCMLDLDAPETTLQHRKIVLKKQFLEKLYTEWYNSFLETIQSLPKGKIVEIGSGGGFLKELDSRIITSDILPLPNCDMTFAAEKMPFEDNSVSAVFMLNVLHHIPDCERFFAEAKRVLISDGIVFMIEPANTVFSRFIYKRFHHEPFNPDVKNWSFDTGKPLSMSNQALPYIIFKRDFEIFSRKFPLLKIEEFRFHTPFRYLLTGGFSFRSLVPGWSFGFVSFMENLIKPLFPFCGLFQTIKLVKK